MDFDKIKKLEDLKKKYSELVAILNQRYRNNKKNFKEKTKSDFKKYFEEKGLEINQTEYSISAKYSSYLVNLSFNKETESYFGCVDIYRLSISNKTHEIIVNEIGSRTKITSTVNSRSSSSEEEKLNNEIEKLQKDIEHAETKIAEQNIPKLGYMILDESNRSGILARENYVESIAELIDSVE